MSIERKHSNKGVDLAILHHYHSLLNRILEISIYQSQKSFK